MHARTLAARGIPGICVLALALVLASCQGRGAKTTTYTVGGTVSGLTGTGLVLQNNGGNNLPISANGAFTFSTALASGSTYRITVLTQPSGQTCAVANGTGTVSANVTNVAVSCISNTFTVGGTVSGLTGTGLALQNNGGNDLAIPADGPFKFSTAIAGGGTYSVTVLTQPSGQGCAVTNGSGSLAGANVTNVAVACVAVAAPAAPTFTIGFGVKELQFAWPPVSGATFYRLLENPDGSGYIQVATNITSSPFKYTIPVHRRLNASYKVQACNAGGCTDAVEQVLGTNLTQAIGYVKASNSQIADNLGLSVALSRDGNTLAVGAPNEDSGSTGVNSAPNESAPGAGAVYVYSRNSGAWVQEAYVKASNTGAGDTFGTSVALSGDGNTLAVGAPNEDSGSTGINSVPNVSAPDAGAVYVFTRSGSNWSQQAYVKASNTGSSDLFGSSVALSGDGNTLAVGASFESSAATGVGGSQTNDCNAAGINCAMFSGAVYVYTRSGNNWSQQAYVKASNTESADLFGFTVALNSDGSTLAVGAVFEDSGHTGVTPGLVDEASSGNGAIDSGAVYVYTRTAGTWSQQAYVKASNTGDNDQFGTSVALSGDGNTLAVGAIGEASSSIGVDSAPNELANGAGAAYVYTRGAGIWSQQAFVKASNTGRGDTFGNAVALSGDGNTLAVGAPFEDSSATGIDTEPDELATDAGAVYFYARTGGTWSQQAYVKASNTGTVDQFGISVALNSDGNTLAVGARFEDGSGTGVSSIGTGGTPNDLAADSGAVYLY